MKTNVEYASWRKLGALMHETVEDEPGQASLRQAVVMMALESWRFGKTFERLLSRIDAGEQARYVSQHRWFSKKVDEALESAGLRLVNVEGQNFDPGMAATALNIDEFSTEDLLVVDQMMEPIIMGAEGVVRSGTVTVRRGFA